MRYFLIISSVLLSVIIAQPTALIFLMLNIYEKLLVLFLEFFKISSI